MSIIFAHVVFVIFIQNVLGEVYTSTYTALNTLLCNEVQ